MDPGFAYLADRPEAVPQIARWWFDEWGHVQPGHSVEALASWIRDRLSRDQLPIHIVAILENRIVGAAVLKLHELFDLYPDRNYWLGSVYVAPDFRGRGIASALAMKVVEIAHSRGIQSLHLQTLRLDGGLYANLGWEAWEQINHEGHDLLVMVKQLEGRAVAAD